MTQAATVALIGMMGCGKTTVGLHLADRLRRPFVDMDAEIEKAANMTVAEIFARDGEAFFRDRETQVLDRLMQGPPCVLSTGGGTYVRAENRALISARGFAIWLRADVDVLWDRVKDRQTRPLLMQDDPYGTLTRIEEERRPIYALAEATIETTAAISPLRIAEEAAQIVARREDGESDA